MNINISPISCVLSHFRRHCVTRPFMIWQMTCSCFSSYFSPRVVSLVTQCVIVDLSMFNFLNLTLPTSCYRGKSLVLSQSLEHEHVEMRNIFLILLSPGYLDPLFGNMKIVSLRNNKINYRVWKKILWCKKMHKIKIHDLGQMGFCIQKLHKMYEVCTF